MPALHQVDIKRFSHFGPEETELLLQVRLQTRTACHLIPTDCLSHRIPGLPVPSALNRLHAVHRCVICGCTPLLAGCNVWHPTTVSDMWQYWLLQAEGIEQVNDRCKLARPQAVHLSPRRQSLAHEAGRGAGSTQER